MEKDREKDSLPKRIWKTLHSMKFGIILLGIIGVLSIAGTLIPQDNALAFYESSYSPMAFKLIETLSLHKVYSSWWFMLLISILSLNLILCSIQRLPVIMKKIKKEPDLDRELTREENLFQREIDEAIDIEGYFKKNGFKNIEEKETSQGTFYYSKKNFIGHLGSWLTHVGLLIIILAYVAGRIFGFDVFVHGVPGSIQPIEGTEYWIEIEDFNIEFRPDDTVDQYISDIKVTDNESNYSESGQVRVNHPFRAKKMNIYQNATGWALEVEARKDGEAISSRTLYQSELYLEDDRNIALQFVKFYPDYVNIDGNPQTKSPYLNNPKLLYSLFYEGYQVDMNIADIGDEIVWEEYSFKIDEPQMFSLLQIGFDPGSKFAALGGLLLIVGVVLAFYIIPRELMALEYKDGRVKIWANSEKNQEIYISQLKLALEETNKEGI